MSRKRPSRIRKDLEAAKASVNTLIGVLRQNESERRWGLGDECAKAIDKLQTLLRDNQAPHEYKVAVIGRFKAGKSTFVNVHLLRRLTARTHIVAAWAVLHRGSRYELEFVAQAT